MENLNKNNFNAHKFNKSFKFSKSFGYILIIFVLVLGFRLYFTFSDSNFSDGSAYTNLRYIHSLLDNFKPVKFDQLSYSGKNIINPPLFYYFMAFISFGSIFILKLLPEILLTLVSILIYFIAKELTESEDYAFISGILSGFIPIFLLKTANQISVFSLVLPLLLFLLYSLSNLDKPFYLWGFITGSFLLPLISPWALLFVFIMFAYLFLLGGGFLTASKIKKEAILVSSLLIMLLTSILYKKPFFEYGFSLIWQNTPINILSDNFRNLSILDVLLQVGILPAILGSIGIYYGITKEKKKTVYLYSGFILAVLLLLVFRLISLLDGLVFVGIALAIFSGLGVKAILSYFEKMRLSNFIKKIIFVIISLVFFISIVPTPLYFSDSLIQVLNANKLDSRLITDIQWASVNLPADAVILGNVYEGEFISGIALRKNVADVNFLLAPKAVERMEDISFIYSTWSEAKALELIHKYKITTIYLSPQTKALFNVKELKYTENKKCFEKQGNFFIIKC